VAHIEKRDGRYRVRYETPAGRRASRTFRRRADAERFMREAEVDIDRGAWVDPRAGSVTLTTWSEEFLLFARRLSPTSQDTYRRDINTYILPTLGQDRIAALRPDVIEHWLNDEIERGLAPSSVHRHYRTLRRMLQVAVDKERLAKNPCDRVDPPRVPKREMVFLTWEHATILLGWWHDPDRPIRDSALEGGLAA
jgi:site-specific recombinase XerC